MSDRGMNIDVLTDDPAQIIGQLNHGHAAGAKIIRWGFANNARAMESWSVAQYREWLLNRLWVFDQCYDTLYANQQPVILTFGHPVGGFDGKRWRIWYDEALMAAHLDNVCLVADRYKNNATAFALAPFNEPSPRKQRQLNNEYSRFITFIRGSGWDKHIVVSHTTDNCDNMSDVPYFGDHAFFYEFHYYKPTSVLEPGARARSFSQEQVYSNIKPVRRWHSKHPNAQILVGEFGCRRESGKGQNQRPFIDACYPVWNKQGYTWCVHSDSYDPNMVFKLPENQFNIMFR